MNKFIKNIRNNNRILITRDNHGLNSTALYHLDCFYNFISGYLNDYNVIIVNDLDDYKNYDKKIRNIDYSIKTISYFRTKHFTTKSMYSADIAIKILNNGDINLIKSRYTDTGNIGNIKNLPIFQRKVKINKILDEIRTKGLHIF